MAETKAIRCRSRSTISRTATLCTRPAESRGADLPPQQRRDVVAVEPIDDPPHLLGPHQVVVDLARLLQRLADRLLGDLVEHQAVDRHLRLQNLAEVPTDGLALAVFVRRQVEVLGVLAAGP